MAIGKIITGQTFGNWLNTTNLLIDEVNQATDSYNAGKLVRWGAGGVITVNNLTSTSLTLSSGSTVNGITDDWSTPIDDSTLMTSNAIHAAIINASDIQLVNPTRITLDQTANTIDVYAANHKVIDITNDGAEINFDANVTFQRNFTVLGQQTQLDVVSLVVEDNNIELNQGAGSSTATAEDAGFTVNKTSAFFKLINTGSKFPTVGTIDIQLNPFGQKYLELDSSGTNTFVTKGTYRLNSKDKITIEYPFPSNATIDALNASTYSGDFYKANDFVLGVGTESDLSAIPYPGRHPFNTYPYIRENDVLGSEHVTYQIVSGGITTTYADYASYKAAFKTSSPGDLIKIIIDPQEGFAGGKWYYWAGEIDPTVKEKEVLYNVNAGGVTEILIDDPDGVYVERNPTIEMYTGDTFKFMFNLSTTNAHPFFISSVPFSDPNRTNPDDTPVLTTTLYGGLTSEAGVEYDVDGTTIGSVTTFWSDFKDATNGTANVTFIPSQPGIYYYWTTANSSDPDFNMGGVIYVYPRNENMGGTINVGLPSGKTVEKSVTYDEVTDTMELDTIPNDTITLNAGDTVRFNVNNVDHTDNVFVLSTNTNPNLSGTMDYDDENVRYTADYTLATETDYLNWTDYQTNFSSNANSVVIFTPLTDGTYYYFANNNPSSFGEIIVLPAVSGDLGAWYLNTGEAVGATATIENPNKFAVTKNKSTVFELDGELADFYGTRNGIRLPNNSYDYTPDANGIIRYNNALNLFEGYTQGQWRGLGGVIDLNQDTYVVTGDTNDIIYAVANSANVAELAEDHVFFETSNVGSEVIGGRTETSNATIRVNSNFEAGKHSINVYGNTVFTSGMGTTYEVGDTTLLVKNKGVSIESTGYLKLPYGTEDDHPQYPENGMMRFAKDTVEVISGGVSELHDTLEYYIEDDWHALSCMSNEWTMVPAIPTTVFEVSNLYYPFKQDEVEVFVYGARALKSDYDVSNDPNQQVYVQAYWRDSTYGPNANTYNFRTAGDSTYSTFSGPLENLGAGAALNGGDTLEIRYVLGNNVFGTTDSSGVPVIDGNTSPILIGKEDSTNPGQILPYSGGGGATVKYFITDDSTPPVKTEYTTVSDFITAFLAANTQVDNIVTIEFKSSSADDLYLFANNDPTITADTTDIIKVLGKTRYTGKVTFADPIDVDVPVVIVHKPGRSIATTTVDAISRSELLSGLPYNIKLSGQTNMGSGQESTSTTTGAVVVSGGVGISGNMFVGRSITELSATALKTNISSIDSALDKVKSLKGVEFNWKTSANEPKEYGLLAEEVAASVPNLVSYQDNKPQGVKYSKVVALLIEAIKQQQDEIDELKSMLPKKRSRKTKIVKE